MTATNQKVTIGNIYVYYPLPITINKIQWNEPLPDYILEDGMNHIKAFLQ